MRGVKIGMEIAFMVHGSEFTVRGWARDGGAQKTQKIRNEPKVMQAGV